MNLYEYDVAVSFAGENRDYVSRVAEILKASGIRVFYDDFESVNMWGKDLYSYLDEIYRYKARFCVMFISEAYRRKRWTNHERESAQAKAFEENEEYILPARFDDAEIPGIRPTLGYVDLREMPPEKFAELVLEKLEGSNRSTALSPSTPDTFRRPKLGGQNFNPYDEALQFIDGLMGELERRCDVLSKDGVSASLFDREGRRCLRVVVKGDTKYSLDVWLGGLIGDDSIGFYGGRGRLSGGTGTSNAWGYIEWDKGAQSAVLKFHDMSLLEFIGSERQFTLPEFTNAVWEIICDALEN